MVLRQLPRNSTARYDPDRAVEHEPVQHLDRTTSPLAGEAGRGASPTLAISIPIDTPSAG